MSKFKLIAIVLALVLLLTLGLSACGPKKPPDEEEVNYTYNTYIGATPSDFNPHTWETNADNIIAGYAEPGWVDSGMAVDENGDPVDGEYAFHYEMATNIVDVTASYAGQWGIDAEAIDGDGLAYEITLNPDACWEDGTLINADSYIYSMQQLLNPEMQNYRANNYYSGDNALVGAYDYYMQGQQTYVITSNLFSTITEAAAECDVYLTLDTETDAAVASGFGVGYSSLLGITGNGAYFEIFTGEEGARTPTGVNFFDKYLAIMAEAGEDVTRLPLTQDIIDDYNNCDRWNPNADVEMVIMTKVYYTFPDCEWEDVSLLKTGEYKLVWINLAPVTEFYFKISCTSNFLVYEDLYEENKTTTDGLVSTTYGTSQDTYMSYGPYKLVSFEDDKAFALAQNDEWFGWTDGNHEGQYQTEEVKFQVLADQQTILQMFQKGQLDDVILTATDMSTFGASPYLLKTPTTYTYRWFFNTDIVDLQAIEAERNDGKNVSILYFDEFRHAWSLALNRTRWCAEVTPGYIPAFSLYNTLYMYDVERNPSSVYRNSDEAMQAVCDLYGVTWGATEEFKTLKEAHDSVTGFNLARAQELFQEAYDLAIAAGYMTAGQEVAINVGATAGAATEQYQSQNTLLQEFIDAATVGTDLEDKITITYIYNLSTRYDDVYNGVREAGHGAWGGAAYYPFSAIRCYTDPDYTNIHESGGFDPTIETLTITADFDPAIDGEETEIKTYQEWAKSINSGIYNPDTPEMLALRLIIMSRLEYGILNMYSCIPCSAEAEVSMISQKVQQATTTYNIMYGYGGVRFMTYNYTNDEWTAYCATQPNGILDYT